MSIGVYVSLGASKIDVPYNLRKETFVLFFGELRARTGSKITIFFTSTHPVSTNCSLFLFTSRLTRQKGPQHDI